MNVPKILSLVRRQTKTTTTMISDVDMVVYLNIVYKKLHRRIVDLDKDYFVREWQTNTTAWVANYSLLEPDSWTELFGQGKIEKINIKFDETDEFYRQVDIRSYDDFMEKGTISYFDNLDRLKTEQSQFTPFAIMKDRSFEIYPTPDVSVVNGLQLIGERKPFDLTPTSGEDKILIPSDYHDLIALGMQKYVYQERNLINEKNDSINEYNREVSHALSNLASVKTKPAISSYNSTLVRFH